VFVVIVDIQEKSAEIVFQLYPVL